MRAVWEDVGPAPDDPRVALYFGFHSMDLAYKRAVRDALAPGRRTRPVTVPSLDHVVYLAMFIVKWPGGDSGFGPHQDPTLVDERRFRGVSIWTPLTPTGVGADGRDNGMLHVVPGSHLLTEGPRVRNIDESVVAPHEQVLMDRYGVGVPTGLGQSIVFDNRLIHYSWPNQTPASRAVLSLGMRPSEARCLLPRGCDDGRIALHEVADETWIDIAASAVADWDPGTTAIATLDPPTPLDECVLDAARHAVGEVPDTVPGRHPRVEHIDPGVFCAFCGASEGLETTDRSGRGRAQLVCAACRERLGHVRGSEPSAESASADREARDPRGGTVECSNACGPARARKRLSEPNDRPDPEPGRSCGSLRSRFRPDRSRSRPRGGVDAIGSSTIWRSLAMRPTSPRACIFRLPRRGGSTNS